MKKKDPDCPCSWCELETLCKSSGESCDNLKQWVESKRSGKSEKENSYNV